MNAYSRGIAASAAAVWFALVFAGSTCAQRPGRGGPPQSQSLTASASVRGAFAEVASGASACVARIWCGDRCVALGAVVAADGLVVTKASELRDGELRCEIGGNTLAARLVGADEPDDVALLRVDATDLIPVRWASEPPSRGAFVVTPDGGDVPVGIGILSSAPYEHAPRRGFLGVRMAQQPPAPARIETVNDDSAARAAGLRAGDVVLALDDRPLRTSSDLTTQLSRRAPGERVLLSIERDGRQQFVYARLRGQARTPSDPQERLWGALSKVRAGFGLVLQHDTVLAPDRCGGPLLDLDGQAIGLNIARAGRVETLALPATTVQAVVSRLRMRD